ncbi:hypothetical protein [uncultured Paraglaciecola sp.]|uniref:hypothetical protein n=1 Tax=uncultured Paraglaciecola sp. TaxID=1765024 RepID=UPI002634D738|nr:hypothetical protein [uncultured Paraglaciecola sp.]
MFGSSSNPYDQSAEYFDQIPGIQQQYLGPYSQMGQTLLPQLHQGYGAMALHPSQVQAGLGQGFQEDPGYQWNVDQQLQAQNQAMAAGGMSGSPESQQFAEQTADQLANQNYNQYLNRNMKIAGSGLQGEQGLETQGYGASNQMAKNMTDYLYNRGNLAGAQAQNKRNMMWGGAGLGASLALGGL